MSALLVALLLSGPGPALAPQDQRAILKTLCDGQVAQDAEGLVCRSGEDRDADLRWSTAIRGRFISADDEWLVSLALPCIGGCRGVTHVVRRTGRVWTRLAETETLVDDSCLVLRGAPDGLVRVACTHAAGPQFGGMTEWLDVLWFAGGEARDRTLVLKEQGGECWTAQPPEKTEYHGDSLSDIAAGTGPVALTARLTIIRLADCDATVEDPASRATVHGTHDLRFVWSGSDIAPDDATAALLGRFGWVPPKD